MKTETLAKIACAYSGMVWGLFWIPLRTLEGAGPVEVWSGESDVLLHLLHAPRAIVAGRVVSRAGVPLAGVTVAPGRLLLYDPAVMCGFLPA